MTEREKNERKREKLQKERTIAEIEKNCRKDRQTQTKGDNQR